LLKVTGSRAWDNTAQWASDLALMASLKYFGIRTSAPLVDSPDGELDLIVAWTASHHSLVHIALWYHISEHRILNYWELNDGAWTCTYGYIDPNFDFFFM